MLAEYIFMSDPMMGENLKCCKMEAVHMAVTHKLSVEFVFNDQRYRADYDSLCDCVIPAPSAVGAGTFLDDVD